MGIPKDHEPKGLRAGSGRIRVALVRDVNNVFDVVTRELTLAEFDKHEEASIFFIYEELCSDIAERHVAGVNCPQKRADLKIRYEEIASSLWCARRKPLSSFEQATFQERLNAIANLWSREEQLLHQDLCAVVDDCGETLEERKRAQRELEKLAADVDSRSSDRLRAACKAGRGSFWKNSEDDDRTPALRLLKDRRKLGRNFRPHLDAVVCRYLRLRQGRSFPLLRLLDMLSSEWLRDKSALWDFVEECLDRWQPIAEKQGAQRRRRVVQQIAGKLNHSAVDIQDQLQKCGILPLAEGCDGHVKQINLIKQDIARGY